MLLLIEYLDDRDNLHIEPLESISQHGELYLINGRYVPWDEWSRVEKAVREAAKSHQSIRLLEHPSP